MNRNGFGADAEQPVHSTWLRTPRKQIMGTVGHPSMCRWPACPTSTSSHPCTHCEQIGTDVESDPNHTLLPSIKDSCMCSVILEKNGVQRTSVRFVILSRLHIWYYFVNECVRNYSCIRWKIESCLVHTPRCSLLLTFRFLFWIKTLDYLSRYNREI